MMLGISLGDHVENVETRRRTRVEDVIARIARMKKRCLDDIGEKTGREDGIMEHGRGGLCSGMDHEKLLKEEEA